MIVSTDEARGDLVELIHFCVVFDFGEKETKMILKARMFNF